MKKDIRKAMLVVTMPDKSKWAVPVQVIAENRAQHYANGEELELSLENDTWPLFESDTFEVEDWAANNMNWSDVLGIAHCVERPEPAVDFNEGWVNGEKEVRTAMECMVLDMRKDQKR